MTLSPILSAWVCPDKGHESATTKWVNQRFDATSEAYARVVDFSLKWRYQLIGAGIFFRCCQHRSIYFSEGTVAC